MDISQARKALQPLLDRYNQNKGNSTFTGNEKQVCQSLIEPFIRDILGWDIEDPSQFKTEVDEARKRIDYVVCNQGISQFIIEAKAASKDVFNNEKAYKQALQYGYWKDRDFAILTNFRQIVILAPKRKYRIPLGAAIAKIDLFSATDEDLKLLIRFEKSYWLASGTENELYGLLKGEPEIPVDERLLDDMKHWREQFLENLRKNHPKWRFDDPKEFRYIEEHVQKFIDRLVFICHCEDKKLNEPQLKMLMKSKAERFTFKQKWLREKISEIFEHYRKRYDSDLFDESHCDKFVIDDDKLVNIIRDLREPKGRLPYNFRHIEADVLGMAYEKFIGHVQTGTKFKEKEDRSKRKEKGIFYTPRYIVDFIVNDAVQTYIKGKSFEEILKVRILDPACGSGSFLISAYNALVTECEKQSGKELTYAQKKQLMLNCIHGVDVDERSREIATFRLSLEMAQRGNLLPSLKDNIHVGDSLIEDADLIGFKAVVWEKHFEEIMKEGFDLVIGNPPWVSLKGKHKSVDVSEDILDYLFDKYPCDQYRPNLFEMFIWRCLGLLKKGGYFSFIVPDRLCSNQQFKELRKEILNKYTLKKLWFRPEFEGVISDNVVFSIQNIKSDSRTQVEIAEYPNTKFENIPQETYSSTSDFSWFIIDKKIYDLFERIRRKEESFPLGEFESSVGFIAKSGKVTDSRIRNEQIRVLKGENVVRWGIRGNFFFHFTKRNLAGGTQDLEKLGKRLKVFLRKTGSDIIATYDDQGTYPEQSLYFIYSEDDNQPDKLKALCGLLNSRLLNCYYHNFAVTNRDATPQLKKMDLDRFPIILPDDLNPLVESVNKALKLAKQFWDLEDYQKVEGKNLIREIKCVDQEIDELVYATYNTTKEEKAFIEDSLQ